MILVNVEILVILVILVNVLNLVFVNLANLVNLVIMVLFFLVTWLISLLLVRGSTRPQSFGRHQLLSMLM